METDSGVRRGIQWRKSAGILRNVVEMFVRGDGGLGQVIEAGIQTAAVYTPQRQEKELVEFMRSVAGG